MRKKQKREIMAAKRAKFEAEVKATGLAAQKWDQQKRAKAAEMTEKMVLELNRQHDATLAIV